MKQKILGLIEIDTYLFFRKRTSTSTLLFSDMPSSIEFAVVGLLAFEQSDRFDDMIAPFFGVFGCLTPFKSMKDSSDIGFRPPEEAASRLLLMSPCALVAV